MKMTNADLEKYVSKKLALPGEERNEYRGQVNRLIENLDAVLATDGTYKIKKFRRGGSLEKGTSNRATSVKPVDADVGVYFDAEDTDNFEIAPLQKLIKKLLSAAYPNKSAEDFDDTGDRTFGVVFIGSGLEVDLVPIVSIDEDANYGFQYSRSGDCVKTSVKVHVDHYREHANADPLLASCLRLLKQWKHWCELDGIQSFHLELILSYLIDTEGPAPTIEEGLRRFYLFVGRDLTSGVTFGAGNVTGFPEPVVILDPANSDNNVAGRIETTEKVRFISEAMRAYETITLAQQTPIMDDTISLWREIFSDSFSIE